MSRPSVPTREPDEHLFAAASALRELVDLFCDRDLDVGLLDEITDSVTRLSARVGEAPQWDRGAALERGLSIPETHEGRRRGFPHRAVGGLANPSAQPMVLEFDFDRGLLTTEITFGPMHSGAPGRVHGGVLAAVFDEFGGAVLRLADTRGATARLCVNYRAPIPMGVPILLSGWIEHQEGRKITVGADARRGDDLIAEMDGLFVVIDYAAIDTSGAARH